MVKKNQKKSFAFCFIASVLLLICCGKNQTAEIIPTGPVNLSIDLNLVTYSYLNAPGSFAYFDGGIKGVLLIHDYDDNWYAFERTCAYQPYNVCSKLWIDSNNIQIKCGNQLFDKFEICCDSRYLFNGFPARGPANSKLAQYKVQRNGNLLLVYN